VGHCRAGQGRNDRLIGRGPCDPCGPCDLIVRNLATAPGWSLLPAAPGVLAVAARRQAHSEQTGNPSTSFTSWLRWWTRKHREHVNSSACFGTTAPSGTPRTGRPLEFNAPPDRSRRRRPARTLSASRLQFLETLFCGFLVGFRVRRNRCHSAPLNRFACRVTASVAKPDATAISINSVVMQPRCRRGYARPRNFFRGGEVPHRSDG
jgi:hypothetical protein